MVFEQGMCFTSFEDFYSLFKQYCANTNTVFVKKHAKTVEGANAGIKNAKNMYPISWKYQSISFECKHYGTYVSKSTGKRRRGGGDPEKASFKNGCLARLRLSANKNKGLVITKVNLQHSGHRPRQKFSGSGVSKSENLLKDVLIPERKMFSEGDAASGMPTLMEDIKTEALLNNYSSEGTSQAASHQGEEEHVYFDHDEDLNRETDFDSPIPRDECAIFAEYVSKKLSKYSDRVRAVVQHHISNTLFNADMGFYDSIDSASNSNSRFDSESTFNSPRS